MIEALQSGLDQTLDFFSRLSPRQLAIEVYRDGDRWSAKQVVAHLVTIERSMHWLFRNMLEGGEGSPADFDPDRFNRKQVPKIDHLPLETLLAQFKEVRTETIEIVRQMSDADLDRTGRHAFLGQGTLKRFIRWAHEHARLHEDDVRKAIGKC